VSDEERPESLAAQAAAWVPPWERPQREPDRAFQEAAENAARAERADDEDRSSAGLSDDDDDFDAAFEGDDPAGYAGVVEEAAAVDAPADDASAEPTDVRVGPSIDVPDAVADVQDEGDGDPVDEPFPLEGDDAGDVFDAAADDDVSDDDEVDIPVEEDAATGDDDEPFASVVVPGQSTGAADAAGAVGDSGSRTSDRAVVDSASPTADGAVVDPASRTSADLPGLEEDAELTAALEAILLVVDEPVGEMHLAEILEQPTERVASALEDISARYTGAGHGFDLRKVAGGWRLYTRPEYAAYVERFVLDGQSVRLTQAALETLAVVAYKQPVTRSRISAIRGVNCDGVMRTLATRGLIEESGTESETGAYLYRTTPLFLEKLGLNSIDQLPPLAPFLPDDVEEVLDAASG
jgi:segregation and condensation protein B